MLLTSKPTKVQTNHLETFYIFGKMNRLTEFRKSGFNGEALIFLCFHHQIINDRMLKPTKETCLKQKYIPKEKTIGRVKNVATDKCA